MDAKYIGETIYDLRKKANMTQSELAEKLNVSAKAVSKWESGKGFPDVTLFPEIARVFGVSIDYLMTQRGGVVVAGNMICDQVKSIAFYPEIGMLTHMYEFTPCVGGCAPNTAINLAKIDRKLPVGVCGSVGHDERGRFILSTLQKNGVNVDGVVSIPDVPTSFCDVMSMPTGERTFFYNKGTNSYFCPDHINVKKLNCDIFHIGYILLLDRFDEPESEYGTKMARFLDSVQKAGIKTSVDVVSDGAADFKKTILPALKYCDYLIVNEIEVTKIFGLEARLENGKLDRNIIEEAMRKCAEAGVKSKVIVHAKEAGFLYRCDTGKFIEVPSLKVPSEMIKGSVGAGDAYAAGSLYGLYNQFSDRKILEFASAAAACNLFSANSVDGMRPKEEIFKMMEEWERLQ